MATKGKTQRKTTAPKKSSNRKADKTAAKKSKATANAKSKSTVSVSREARHQMIAEVAYKIAAMRQFRDADPLGDWLAAEREIDQKLATGVSI